MSLKRELENDMSTLFQTLDRSFPNVTFGKPKITTHLTGQVEVSGSSVLTSKRGGDIEDAELEKIEKRVEQALKSSRDLDLIGSMEVGFDYDEDAQGRIVFIVTAIEPDQSP